MAHRSARSRWRQRWLDYPLQAAALWLLYGLFRLLPLDTASALGGRLARYIGPRLAASRKALSNLQRAMPELDAAARQEVLAGMWENLGRVAAEYPHIARLWGRGGDCRVEILGSEHLRAAAASGKPAILVSGHLANWELLSHAAALHGLPLTLVYRRPNNPLVARLLDRAREAIDGEHVEKGRNGARALLAALRAGRSVGMLMDQKFNDGVPVPFFGRDAMTAPAAAQFAVRFKAPMLPARIERLEGARFRLTVLPPLPVPEGDTEDGSEGAAHALLVRFNALLESWIRERPAQWLWLHRRWPD
ncbi:lysophospholipid acyltransferase family protein [Arenibaculum pallidiluteum]|uniref:lysophospholipid acyltransferase family protein n=1 Tax=Arenibaculum pallidiluteum TaxID=2812559 RepID=UPI001A95D695|nr:lauroyl acyltransferase [Arenibaculum pallidiluteum]